MMNAARKELYDLITALPRKELKTAKRILKALVTPEDAPVYTFEYDDEPLDDEDRKAIAEAKKDIAEGRFLPIEQVMEKIEKGEIR